MMINKLVEKAQTLPYSEETQLRLVILDSMWNKSPTFCSYLLNKRLKLGSQVIIIEKSSNFIKNMSKMPSNKEVVAIFIDDVIGTGKQFVKRYKSDFEKKYEKWNLKDKNNISYYLVAGVGSIDSIEYISSNTILSKDSIRYSKLIRKSDKAFYPPIWNNKEELTKIKEFLKDADSKYWDGWKGIGEVGLQYLVVLDWNTPNNTIGCLWNRTESWDPLFPRSS